VWKENAYGSERAIAVHIRHLREKIEIDPANPRFIKAVWGQGYRFLGG
ncbi:MAG: winged helix-turn-helix domain-containing protein, partial [Lachnospiraceae bacterium]|nr:winged helix-turn-helix domain-containing protein [Lachnospiraceae bacterium]